MAGRWRVLASGAIAAGALAGCGSATPAAAPPAPAPVVAAVTATAAPTPTVTPVLVGGVAVEDLCAFLAGDVPRLQQGSVGAVALLASDLQSFYAYQGLPRPDGAVIDHATAQACPETRFAVLVALQQQNLNSL